MPDTIDREFLRTLARWRSNGHPVASLYLDVDGRRYPRRQDYLARAEALCHQLTRQAEPLGHDPACSVAKDAGRMLDVLGSLERGHTKGAALFACSEAGLWEEVLVPRPVPDRAVVADHPHVLPLEAMVETYESFCTALVDRGKARIFLARMGRIREETDVFGDVPGRHDQGGRSQARFQRHVDEHAGKHLKNVAETLLKYLEGRGFDHLILAGPEQVRAEFEGMLHDYLRRRVVARVSLPVTASINQVLERSLRVEEELEAAREREVVGRVTAEAAAGRHAVTGLDPVLPALNEGRVDTLVVTSGTPVEGVRCPACGWLGAGEAACGACGSATESAPDVVEEAVAKALRSGSRVETLTWLNANGGVPFEVGALLRF